MPYVEARAVMSLDDCLVMSCLPHETLTIVYQARYRSMAIHIAMPTDKELHAHPTDNELASTFLRSYRPFTFKSTHQQEGSASGCFVAWTSVLSCHGNYQNN